MAMLAQVLLELLPKRGQHRRGEDLDSADRAEDVGGHHQPAGLEAQVRVDGAADPLEGGAALAFHMFSRR